MKYQKPHKCWNVSEVTIAFQYVGQSSELLLCKEYNLHQSNVKTLYAFYICYFWQILLQRPKTFFQMVHFGSFWFCFTRLPFPLQFSTACRGWDYHYSCGSSTTVSQQTWHKAAHSTEPMDARNGIALLTSQFSWTNRRSTVCIRHIFITVRLIWNLTQGGTK